MCFIMMYVTGHYFIKMGEDDEKVAISDKAY